MARRVERRRTSDQRRRRAQSADTVTGCSGSTGRSTSVPPICMASPPPASPPPPPPPPPPGLAGRGGDADAVWDSAAADWAAGARRSNAQLVVVPRSTTIQAMEDELSQLALVATIGGTRPWISTQMVYQYLNTRFDIRYDEADVRVHEPEDFIVRFASRPLRDRVLASRPGGYLCPLSWRPWTRAAGGVAGPSLIGWWLPCATSRRTRVML